MRDYEKELAEVLADSGALFFAEGLRLKDGRPTPYFINLGLFRTGRLIGLLGEYMARMLVDRNIADKMDVVVGPSYKGSALAVATVQKLWAEHGLDLLFDYDRKEVKTHGEATGQKGRFVTNALFSGARVFIVDDVGTSMGTKYDLLALLENESRRRGLALQVVGVGLAVDRQQTTAVTDENGRVVEGRKGEDAIAGFTGETGIPVHCLLGVRDLMVHLYESGRPVMVDGQKRPLDADTMARFQKYMDVYGVDRSQR